MTPNRIICAAGVRRALPAVLLTLVVATALSACGGDGTDSAGSVADKAADAELLNEVLARQSAVVVANGHTMRGHGGQALAAARLFRVQEQEHVDAVLDALRSLDAAAEPPAEAIDVGGLKSEVDYLHFLYALESETIETELAAIAKLTDPPARSMLAATVADQAQHLVLLRRELGANWQETVPRPFEDGTTPAP